METVAIRFNRNLIQATGGMEPVSEAEIRCTPGLLRASLDDALMYGGDVTRSALSAMHLLHDRKHIVVDVKVHMLMAGMIPAIPGWHTDGVPRGGRGGVWSPAGPMPPDMVMQDWGASTGVRAPRYHLIVSDTPPSFLVPEITLDIPAQPTNSLYRVVSRQVEDMQPVEVRIKPWITYTWDWWSLHSANQADHRHWRYFIRVTETDHLAPSSDLREVMRNQQQVYVPMEFGW